MARLELLPEPMRSHISKLICPRFETTPWAEGPPLAQRRIAIISTAGLHARGERPFSSFSEEYRVIAGDVRADDLIMSHISVNFDRSGFQQDWNVVFPIDRLRELAEAGAIGSVADFHYSFMGATDPAKMAETANTVAKLLQKDGVNGVLLAPV